MTSCGPWTPSAPILAIRANLCPVSASFLSREAESSSNSVPPLRCYLSWGVGEPGPRVWRAEDLLGGLWASVSPCVGIWRDNILAGPSSPDVIDQSQCSFCLKLIFLVLWDLNKNALEFPTSHLVEIQWRPQDVFKFQWPTKSWSLPALSFCPQCTFPSLLCPSFLSAQCQSRQPRADLTFSVHLIY